MRCYFDPSQEEILINALKGTKIPFHWVNKQYSTLFTEELYIEIFTLKREELELLLKLGVQRIFLGFWNKS